MSTPESTQSHYPADNNRKMYKGMMDFGFIVGLPVGGAIAMLVATLLMDAGLIVSFFVSFLTWLGLYAISKSFFIH